MKDDRNYSVEPSDVLLDNLYLKLLNSFKIYNPRGNKLFCSYVTQGRKNSNELLIIGREPIFWPEDFYISELNSQGEELIFNTKVKEPAINGIDSSCPLRYALDLWGQTPERNKYNTSFYTNHDSFWGFIKDLVIKLGLCQDESKWPCYIALTYLYKLAYSNHRFILNKPKTMQMDYCRKILNLEIEILKPKRILFLTGLNFAKEFLDLPDSLEMAAPVHSLGYYKFGDHIAKTLITVNPKKYQRNELVELLLNELT